MTSPSAQPETLTSVAPAKPTSLDALSETTVSAPKTPQTIETSVLPTALFWPMPTSQLAQPTSSRVSPLTVRPAFIQPSGESSLTLPIIRPPNVSAAKPLASAKPTYVSAPSAPRVSPVRVAPPFWRYALASGSPTPKPPFSCGINVARSLTKAVWTTLAPLLPTSRVVFYEPAPMKLASPQTLLRAGLAPR